MAIYIEGNRKIKSIFANVNGTKKSISSVWVNKDGIPKKVFQLDHGTVDLYEIAPEGENNDWDYALDNENNIIILNYYKGTKTDVIVYANYVIGGITYKTKIANAISFSHTYMFANKENIKTVKFSDSLDTSNVTDMGGMFTQCEALTDMDISKFDTSNVTNMNSMFSGCSSLTELNLSSFDTKM